MKTLNTKITPGAILVFILFVMTISLLILRINLALSYLPEIGGVSINVMYGIIRILSGSELYTNPEIAPYSIIQYMPLHFHIVALLGKLLGIANDVHAMMVLHRVFCLSIDVATFILLAKTLFKTIQVNKVISLTLASIYFLSIPSIIYARVDNLYLFFFVATIAVLLKDILRNDGKTSTTIPRLLFCGALCALTIMTKQTGIFLLAFCSIYYVFIQKSVYQWSIFMAGMITLLLVFGLFLFPSPLLSLKLNVIDGVKNGFNANWFIEVLLKNFFLKFSYVLAAGFFIALSLFKERSKQGYLFLAVGLAWYFTTATLSSFKAGSGANYYLEFIALSILGSALLIKNQLGPTRGVVLYALMLSPFFIISAANDKGWGDLGMMKEAKKNYLNTIEVANYLRPKIQTDEWVLTDFHKENTLNLQLVDKALFPCREVALYFTRPLGVFHFNEFETLVKNGKIPYLVTRKGETLEEFIDVPLNQYKPDTTIGNFQVFKKLN